MEAVAKPRAALGHVTNGAQVAGVLDCLWGRNTHGEVDDGAENRAQRERGGGLGTDDARGKDHSASLKQGTAVEGCRHGDLLLVHEL